MARLYTEEQKQEVLRSLRIKPIDGKVTGNEAAQILQWRAKEEFGVDRYYNNASLRKHVENKTLHAEPNNRKSRYLVAEVFDLTLSPRRGRANKSQKAQEAA